ncbi:hypothetical protein [Bradyrhizobium sp. CCGUVB1N3]|uniref:hypothetical protein n=1 Tax=Bradyrhizobium sp. CCGUVB1N3 TaxID=2949629 RepID=UPI003531BCEF
MAFVFNEIATGAAAVEAELAETAGTEKTKRAPQPRKEFDAHLEVETVIEPEVTWLRRVGEGPDRRGRVEGPDRDAGENPPDCDVPPERRT